jgi:hypothetical protein
MLVVGDLGRIAERVIRPSQNKVKLRTIFASIPRYGNLLRTARTVSIGMWQLRTRLYLPISAQRLLHDAHGLSQSDLDTSEEIVLGVLGEKVIKLLLQVMADVVKGAGCVMTIWCCHRGGVRIEM